MIVRKHRQQILENCKRLNILKGVLIQAGNKARIYNYILYFFKFLKNPKNIKGISKSFRRQPLQVINTALNNSSPFFTYKRICKIR